MTSLSSNLVSVQTPSLHQLLKQVPAVVDLLLHQVTFVPSLKQCTSLGHHQPSVRRDRYCHRLRIAKEWEAYLDMTLRRAGERVDHDRKNIWQRQVRRVWRPLRGCLILEVDLIEKRRS